MKSFKLGLGFIGLFFFSLLFGCVPHTDEERGVYHWRTNFDLTNAENTFLTEQRITRIYTKFFDIKLNANNEAIPVAEINFISEPNQDIIPVVYITTDVFSSIDSTGVRKLATKTYNRITALFPQKKIKEIQIDCDWMDSIRDKYFYFLSELKSKMEMATLSCTIRLYQYKYPDLSGVPPVEKGVLMYYNMGDLTDYEEKNSILNNEIGEQYLGFGKYPLPLDMALPNFSWTLVYRYGDFIRIKSDLTIENLSDTSLFQFKENGYYFVKKDTLIDDFFLRFGDELRYEYCKEEELVIAAKLLQQERNQSTTRLLIYDLKPNILDENDKIHTVFTAFELQ